MDDLERQREAVDGSKVAVLVHDRAVGVGHRDGQRAIGVDQDVEGGRPGRGDGNAPQRLPVALGRSEIGERAAVAAKIGRCESRRRDRAERSQFAVLVKVGGQGRVVGVHRVGALAVEIEARADDVAATPHDEAVAVAFGTHVVRAPVLRLR